MRMAAQVAGSAEERADFQQMAEHWIRKAEDAARGGTAAE